MLLRAAQPHAPGERTPVGPRGAPLTALPGPGVVGAGIFGLTSAQASGKLASTKGSKRPVSPHPAERGEQYSGRLTENESLPCLALISLNYVTTTALIATRHNK